MSRVLNVNFWLGNIKRLIVDVSSASGLVRTIDSLGALGTKNLEELIIIDKYAPQTWAQGLVSTELVYRTSPTYRTPEAFRAAVEEKFRARDDIKTPTVKMISPQDLELEIAQNTPDSQFE